MRPDHERIHKYCGGKGADIGCGENDDRRFPDAIAVDIDPKCSPDMIMDGNNLTFENESLDYLVSFHCLEHHIEPLKVLKEWKRVVKKDGILGIAIPDITRNIKIKNGGHGLNSGKGHIKHLSMMTLEELIEMFKQLDLKILEYGDDADPEWSVYIIGRK